MEGRALALLSFPSPPPLESPGRALDGLGAQARQVDRFQPPAARHRRGGLHHPRRRPQHPIPGPLRHYAGCRHPVAAGRGPAPYRHGHSSSESAVDKSKGESCHARLWHSAAARKRFTPQLLRITVCPHLFREYWNRSLYHSCLRRLSRSLWRRKLHRKGLV